MRSIKNLNLNKFSYIKQVDGQIRAQRDKISLYGELALRKGLFQEDHSRDCQEIDELRRICAKKQIELDKQELINCLCIKRNPTSVSQLMTQM